MIDPDDEGLLSGDQYLLLAKVTLVFAVGIALAVIAPASYHFIQPADHYLEVDDISVDLASGDDYDDPCTFELTTTYYSRYDQVVTVDTTLYAVENESLAEVQHWREEGYLPQGVHQVSFERSIDEPLSFGTYQFQFRVSFVAPEGFEKTLEAESERFLVHHGTPRTDGQTPDGSGFTVNETDNRSATITTPEPTPSPTPTPVAPGIDTVFVYPSISRCP